MRVEKGKTKLIVDHLGRDLAFIDPVYGPDKLGTIKQQIQEEGLQAATIAETISLIHGALKSKSQHSIDLIYSVSHIFLLGDTGMLYVPQEGIYIQDSPISKFGFIQMDQSELEAKITEGDPSVRYIQRSSGDFEFYGGSDGKSALELSENSLAIALVGEEGAYKLAQIVQDHGVRVSVEDGFEYSTSSGPHLTQLHIDSYRGGKVDSISLSSAVGFCDESYLFGVQK
jgi:hypothetical protein